MNNFGLYLSPEQMFARDTSINGKPLYTLQEYIERSNIDERCSVCEMEDVWKYGGTHMCFSCMTGEHDASDEMELI